MFDDSRAADPLSQLWRVAGAALMVASGFIHLRLWFEAYRNVATLNWLFLVQLAAAVVLAVAILVSRSRLLTLAGALLMAGTIGGLILARTSTIFGFHLPFISGLAVASIVCEGVAVITLSLSLSLSRSPSPTRVHQPLTRAPVK